MTDPTREQRAAEINARAHNASVAIPPRSEVSRYDQLSPEARALLEDFDELDLAEMLAASNAPGSPDAHVYLSTGCFHGDHDYCKSMTGLNGAKRPASCKKCGAKCICPCHQGEEPADAYEQAVARVESSGPRPEAPEATDPDTITDPQWLRQQYAAAMYRLKCPYGNPWENTLLTDRPPFLQLADAVLAVRDRHPMQLRQRLELADADLDHYEERVVGDLNEANIGLARQAARAEQQRNQLADDLRYALDDHGPRHTHKQPGTWDDSGAPCAHCIRLEQARQHLTNLTPAEA